MLWDDSSHVTRADLRSLHGLWLIWSHLGSTQQYYPLLHSAFWVEHRVWGDNVLGYHLVNVALHAISAFLVVKIVRRLALPGAWFAGLCFALHPICVEAVAWISEQKSVLSGVFYLAAALAYLHFDESHKRSTYLMATSLFVLALLSKTVTAVLPAVLLVILWWKRGRGDWRRDVQPLALWLVIGSAAGIFTAWVEATYIGANGASFALSGVQRVLVAGRVICFYLGKIVWPVNLTFFYSRWNLNPREWWQYLFPAGLLLMTGGLLALARRRRGPLAAFLIFGGTLFPVLGFLNIYPFRYSFVADHFAYLASLGIIVPVISTLSGRPRRIESRLLPAILAIALGVLTWQRAGTYRDEETLYRATIARNPDAFLAHNNLANLLLSDPAKRAEAIEHLETAARLNPDFWEAHLSLGNALAATPGKFKEAIAQFETAVRLAPDSDRAQTNLGNALLQAGQTEQGVMHLRTALQIQPGNAEAHNDLGNGLLTESQTAQAISEYRTAIQLNPEFAEAYNNLGRALAQAGRLAESIPQFQAAIRIRPDYWGAHSNLGNALAATPGRESEALAEYQAALKLRPTSAAAHNNMGYFLVRTPGRLSDAVSEFRQAVALDPASADSHYNLAMALSQMPGRQMEALSELESVMKLRPSPQIQQMIDRLRGAPR